MPDAPFDSAVLVVTVWVDADGRVLGRLLARPVGGGEASDRPVLGVEGVVEGVQAWLHEVIPELR